MPVIDYIAAYWMADIAARHVNDRINEARPGATARMLATRAGQVLSKLSVGRFSRTLTAGLLAGGATFALASHAQSPGDPIGLGTAVISVAAFMGLSGLMTVVRDEHAKTAPEISPPAEASETLPSRRLRGPGR